MSRGREVRHVQDKVCSAILLCAQAAYADLGDHPCPWDLDYNGNVGASDLLALIANWGPCP